MGLGDFALAEVKGAGDGDGMKGAFVLPAALFGVGASHFEFAGGDEDEDDGGLFVDDFLRPAGTGVGLGGRSVGGAAA